MALIAGGCTTIPEATKPEAVKTSSSAAPPAAEPKATPSATPDAADPKSAKSSKININTATNAELDKLELPGTKPSLSERIEGGRPYKQIDDLVTKKAISAEEFKLIQNLVTTETK
ncbi:MAG: helix-hairpin-helix domain-containing protein [Pseudanabaena sp.]|uniref:ComEA family DNA-binding protein n=1 Tax=Pseudanabaena mucicola TaxID=71190 RepID=UPI00257913CB|nr:helix-hairpin-helix domain-containing protein [Pseudanabaena mucicola]MCE2975559.1 helix-hairpin-helix domain-containing protein [Pseudanabaena sp. CoA8_M7]